MRFIANRPGPKSRPRPMYLVRGVLAAVASAGLAVLASSAPAAAKPAGTTTLVVASSEGFGTAVVSHFEQATRIHIRLVSGTTRAVVSDLSSDKKHTMWGVVWVDGPATLAALDRDHMLVHGVSTGHALNSLGTRLLPKDHSYVPTGVTLDDAILYTVNAVSAFPTSWKQLLQPQWEGEVVVSNPRLTGATYPYIAGMMYSLGGNRDGIQAGESYFLSLKAKRLQVKTTYTEVVQAVLKGKAKLALVPSSVAVAAIQRHPTLRAAYPAPVTLDSSVIGIDADASKTERNEARSFVNYVLSKAGQQVMQRTTLANASYYYPVVTGVPTPTALPSLSGLATQTITPYVWGPRQGAVLAWFNSHVVK